MPIPLPIPSAPPSPSTIEGDFAVQQSQPWVSDQIRRQHTEVLYTYGEYAMFLLMWTALDYEAGRVGKCTTCNDTGTVSDRYASAYNQPLREKCPDCYGTLFEGGYRAKIIRPSLWNDGAPDTNQTPRGFVVSNTFAVETTDDFTMHHQDFVFRVTGDRFSAQTLSPTFIQSGFISPELGGMRVGSQVPQVQLEDKASVAYIIQPTDPAVLLAILGQTVYFDADFSEVEDIRGPLVLHASE